MKTNMNTDGKLPPEEKKLLKAEIKKAMAENLKALVGKVPGLLTVEFVDAPIPSSTLAPIAEC